MLLPQTHSFMELENHGQVTALACRVCKLVAHALLLTIHVVFGTTSIWSVWHFGHLVAWGRSLVGQSSGVVFGGVIVTWLLKTFYVVVWHVWGTPPPLEVSASSLFLNASGIGFWSYVKKLKIKKKYMISYYMIHLHMAFLDNVTNSCTNNSTSGIRRRRRRRYWHVAQFEDVGQLLWWFALMAKPVIQGR
jgi:hypothetical protein